MVPDYIITGAAFVAVILNFIVLGRQASKKDLWSSTTILLFGGFLYMMLIMDIPLPSFVIVMSHVFGPLAKPVMQWVTEGKVIHG
ncbi:hypothetical protein [Paenibacillus sp. XY044]|uniref:hypothetical protein n=1 Tax=Paenibacillus sp. XY044 TaxID=2026089 RepID=UPI000B9811ED|nr:hypothetical protein [Paenibacillus sp. XY044]OZB97980.1 hypothetical protein CJP46_02100 [Paenibacillus sp. XY044]